jgi:hypothetical protein
MKLKQVHVHSVFKPWTEPTASGRRRQKVNKQADRTKA